MDYLSFIKSTIRTLNGIKCKLESLVKSSKNIIPLNSLILEQIDEKKQLKSFKMIPGPASFPFIGTTWQYWKFVGRYDLSKLHEAHMDRYQRYGPIVQEKSGRHYIVHLFDTKDFEQVFRNQGSEPIRPESQFITFYRNKNTDKYPSVGLAHSQGEEWSRERKILAPILLRNQNVLGIKGQNDICNDVVSFIKHELESNNCDYISDIRDAMYRLSLESVCHMCLDTRIGCLDHPDESTKEGVKLQEEGSDAINVPPSEQLITSTKNLFKSYNDLYYSSNQLWKYIDTPSYKSYMTSEREIYDLASKYVDDKWNVIKNGSISSEDSIPSSAPATSTEIPVTASGQCPLDDQYLENYDNQASCSNALSGSSLLEVLLTSKNMDINHARVIVVDLIAGGIFTISNSLCFLIHHLSRNCDIQERLFDELIDVLNGNPNQEITNDHLKQMSFLKACIKESFRLTSTVPAIVRVLPQDTVLSGHVVPKGTTVFSHFLVTCQLNQYFDNPFKFDPDRWLKTMSKDSRFASLPFGFGPRMCAGRRFAELELMMATAKLVLNFKMESSIEKLDRIHAFVVVPSGPIGMKFVPRIYESQVSTFDERLKKVSNGSEGLIERQLLQNSKNNNRWEKERIKS